MTSEALAAGPPVTLVDSNVLLDVLTGDAAWGEWSEEALARAGDEGRLVINPIIYVEISTGFEEIEDLDDAVPAGDLENQNVLPSIARASPRPKRTRRACPRAVAEAGSNSSSLCPA